MTRRVARQLAEKSSRVLLLAPLAMLSLFGCATIIGLDEYTVAKSSGAGTSPGGGAGKDGSSAGRGGGTGEAGASGIGGESGESGNGGQSGGGQLPPIVGCDGQTAFEPNEQIVRSCILRAGCDPTFAPVRTISTCVTYDTQAALPGEACNLTSTSCADFEACEHVGIAHGDLCGGSSATGTRCQGDLAANCGNYEGDDRFFDCAALGGTCGTFTYNGTLFADCKLDISPDSCVGMPSTDAKAFCHSGGGKTDDLRYYCWGGQAFGASCSSVASCIDTPSDGSSDPSRPSARVAPSSATTAARSASPAALPAAASIASRQAARLRTSTWRARRAARTMVRASPFATAAPTTASIVRSTVSSAAQAVRIRTAVERSRLAAFSRQTASRQI
jgi:hypothetical protein